MCDMTHSYATWLIHVWRHISCVTHTQTSIEFRRALCDMTHPCVTWLIHTRHDSLMCDTTHFMCDTHRDNYWCRHIMWHESFTRNVTHFIKFHVRHSWTGNVCVSVVSVCVCIHIYVYIFIFVYVFMYTYMYMIVNIYIRIYNICICICIYTYIYVYIYIYMYVYTCIYVCMYTYLY